MYRYGFYKQDFSAAEFEEFVAYAKKHFKDIIVTPNRVYFNTTPQKLKAATDVMDVSAFGLAMGTITFDEKNFEPKIY